MQPIDKLVFGEVALGKQIGRHKVAHPAFVDEDYGDDEDEGENFQLANPTVAPGMASYAYAQMRHLMIAPEEVAIRRENKTALAVYPYREGIQYGDTALLKGSKRGRLVLRGTRSAMVVQAAEDISPVQEDADDQYVVTRENQAMLVSDAIALGYTAEEAAEISGSGEYDHLLQNWCNRSDNHEIMSDDDEGEDDGATTTVSEAENGDDLAEEEDEAAASSPASASGLGACTSASPGAVLCSSLLSTVFTASSKTLALFARFFFFLGGGASILAR